MHKLLMLSKVWNYLNKEVALRIYKTMILPYFDYYDVIYNTANADGLDKLQRLQNKCLKIYLSLNRTHDTDDLHSQAKCPMLQAKASGAYL